MTNNEQVAGEVAAVYEWLDSELGNKVELAGTCRICGRCCDFAAYGHRLYVTTPEMIHLAAALGGGNIRRMPGRKCPYLQQGKCTIHPYRFAACRIFCCSGDARFQTEITESVLKKLKSVCARLSVQYRYVELATALNEVLPNICQSAGKPSAEGRED